MRAELHPKFRKEFAKLRASEQRAFAERLKLFIFEPHHPQLHTHRLKGSFAGYWSINVNGDLRAVYKQVERDLVVFIRIGSHSQLYK